MRTVSLVHAATLAMMMTPGPYAAWRTTGPEGGWVYCFARTADTLWAGTYGGVWRSNDHGESWSFSGLGRSNIFHLCALDGRLFACANEGWVVYRYSGGTWQPLGLTIPRDGENNYYVRSISAWRGMVFVGADTSLYRSTDYGDSWTRLSLPPDEELSATCLTGHPRYLFAVFNGALSRTADSGRTWEPVYPYGWTHGLFVSDSTIYALTYPAGPFRSRDNGDTWTACTTGLEGGFGLYMASSGDTLYMSSGVGSPVQGIYRSTNGGDYWACTFTAGGNGVQQLIGAGAGRVVAVLSERGLIASDDGLHWHPANTGLAAAYAGGMAVLDDTLIVGVLGDALHRSGDSGATWRADISRIGGNLRGDLVAHGGRLLSSYRGTVYGSDDRGRTWAPSDSGIQSGGQTGEWVFALHAGTLYAGGYETRIYRSLDSGRHWTWAYAGLPPNKVVRALASNGSWLFAGIYGSGVYRTNDEGQSWTAVNTGLPGSGPKVLALAATDTALVAALDSNGIYRSTDNGVTWTASHWNGWHYSQRCVVLGVAEDLLFVGTDTGVFVSPDFGVTWFAISDGLEDVVLTSVNRLASLNGKVYLSTSNRSVCQRELAEIRTAITPTGASRRAPVAAVPAQAGVRVTVFDAAGRLVRSTTCRDGIGGPAEAALSGLPAGTYVIVLRGAGDTRNTARRVAVSRARR